MTVTAINSLEEFKNLINSGKPIVIDFWATWCGPCKAISPIFEKMSEENPSVDFYKVDVDEQPDIAQEVGIRAMPTFITFKDGQKVNDLLGADRAALKNLITSVAQPPLVISKRRPRIVVKAVQQAMNILGKVTTASDVPAVRPLFSYFKEATELVVNAVHPLVVRAIHQVMSASRKAAAVGRVSAIQPLFSYLEKATELVVKAVHQALSTLKKIAADSGVPAVQPLFSYLDEATALVVTLSTGSRNRLGKTVGAISGERC
ncbi:hypothetical protein BGX21_003801 [Mortierella sp. AD011]|nr:hypothetical protein BGX20_003062 [Mortierella sp. AD010]KAF9400650.1 hypothetical protein BGX21_003801 [Mortierella sp. AD011]